MSVFLELFCLIRRLLEVRLLTRLVQVLLEGWESACLTRLFRERKLVRLVYSQWRFLADRRSKDFLSLAVTLILYIALSVLDMVYKLSHLIFELVLVEVCLLVELRKIRAYYGFMLFMQVLKLIW
jgi:hypothetical protein